MRVLIGEDEPRIVEILSAALSIRWPNSEVDIESTGKGTLAAARGHPYDLIVLDINFPDYDGFDILQAVRERSQVPVIMLTGRASVTDKVRAFDLGADDYMTKPFSPFEFVARVSSVLRRLASTKQGAAHAGSTVISSGLLSIDPATAEASVKGKPVSLTPIEFKILERLIRADGVIVSHETLMREIWGEAPSPVNSHRLKLHMKNLRAKIGDDASDPQMIETVRGFGYRLVGS